MANSAAKDRLHDVFPAHSTGEPAAKLLLRKPRQPCRIPGEQFVRRPRIAGLQLLNELG
jgi:hypothetical protein